MFLALREIRRAKARFALLVAAIGLLVFLILTQQALQTGLLTSFVGAIERQSAPVLVYSVDGQRTLQGSIITPDLQATTEGVDGVAASGRIGQGTFTATIAGGAPDDVAIIGYDDPDLGAPETLAAGRLPEGLTEAVGSSVDFVLGDRIEVLPGDGDTYQLEIVGLADDVQIQVTATVFTPWAGYEAAVRAANPDATAVLPSALGLAPVDGVTDEELAERVNAASDEADVLPREEAAAQAPGVNEVRTSFFIIFGLYGLVVPLVTGLFFLIVTFQKSRALTLLHALGAPSSYLVRSLLIQVVLIIFAGLVLGTALYVPVSQAELGTIALRYNAGAVWFWSILLMALGVVSGPASARRVLAIDPIEATVGEGGR